MIANALLATTVLLLALVFVVLDACRFLVPYRAWILREYSVPLAVLAAVLFFNVFGVVVLVTRTFFLKDTGRKLAHLEKQVRAYPSVVEDLAQRQED